MVWWGRSGCRNFSIQFVLFFFYFLNKFYLFIYFGLCRVFIVACRLSLVAASGGYSSLQCAGFSFWWLLLLRSTGSRRAGFSSCGSRAQQLWLTGSRAQAQQLWPPAQLLRDPPGPGLEPRVPCIGRWILNHCTTREAPIQFVLNHERSLHNQQNLNR